MTIEQVALQLWPCWMLGLLMVFLTWKSEYRSILKIDPKALLKFAGWMCVVTGIRFLMFKFLMPDGMIDAARSMTALIPWQALLGVFWEDACHSMPLVLAGLMYGGSKWYPWLSKVALAVVMLSFGSGHIYQGLVPAIGLSFYIPIAMKLGKKYGFGTVMLCHIMYDMSTLFGLKWMLG